MRAESGWVAGVGCQLIATEPKKGPPREWCKQYSLSQSASFRCSVLGDPESLTLAVQWCEKMQYLYNIYKAQPDAKYVYTREDVTSYIETTWYQSFAGSFPCDGPVGEKIAMIRAIQPQIP